jgi:alanine racemase
MAEYYRCYKEVDLDIIEKNFDALKALTKDGVKAMAVVKADAYGHGAVRVAQKLKDKADFFAVATAREGMELRENGIKNPILVLSYCAPAEYDLILKYGITPTISSEEDAYILNAAAGALGINCKIHVAVDTGMSRIGVSDNESGFYAVQTMAMMPNITIEGIFSHFAKADYKDKTSADRQTARFEAFVNRLEAEGVSIPIKHICNSAGLIEFDTQHYDMVRMGLALYGLYPSDEVQKDRVQLTPAMKVVSHVIHIKDIDEGTPVSYGESYVAKEKKKIATVSIGYADGYNRSFSDTGYVMIKGEKAPIIGKVCMDLAVVDISHIPGVKIGMPATVLGDGITAEDLGRMCGSFNYEVVCNFAKRVTAVYKG